MINRMCNVSERTRRRRLAHSFSLSSPDHLSLRGRRPIPSVALVIARASALVVSRAPPRLASRVSRRRPPRLAPRRRLEPRARARPLHPSSASSPTHRVFCTFRVSIYVSRHSTKTNESRAPSPSVAATRVDGADRSSIDRSSQPRVSSHPRLSPLDRARPPSPHRSLRLSPSLRHRLAPFFNLKQDVDRSRARTNVRTGGVCARVMSTKGGLDGVHAPLDPRLVVVPRDGSTFSFSSSSSSASSHRPRRNTTPPRRWR